MRYLLIPIMLAFCIGCKDKEDLLRKKFHLMSDSSTYFYNKWKCCFDNGERGKAKSFAIRQSMFVDSAEKYYALLYPNGNPQNKKEEEKKPDCNCN